MRALGMGRGRRRVGRGHDAMVSRSFVAPFADRRSPLSGIRVAHSAADTLLLWLVAVVAAIEGETRWRTRSACLVGFRSP